MEPLPAAAALMDELVEEILLRIPPDDPARLLHAALVCKRWCRIVSDSGFRRRFQPGPFGSVALGGCLPLFWNPITGERRGLPVLPTGPIETGSWNAAVLCGAAIGGCEHLDCHRRPFLVVFVGSGRGLETYGMYAHVYSSETDAWSKQISAPHFDDAIQLAPSALAQNVLYFQCMHSVLKYDLAKQELSLIIPPEECFFWGRHLPMATEDGGVGLAYICSSRLYLWSKKTGPDNGAGWASKVINLTSLLPAHDDSLVRMALTGVAHDLDVLFVSTSVGIFTIDLKSVRATKVCEESCCDESFPYMSFCTPALGAASAEG